jgi:hypothetical protein
MISLTIKFPREGVHLDHLIEICHHQSKQIKVQLI